MKRRCYALLLIAAALHSRSLAGSERNELVASKAENAFSIAIAVSNRGTKRTINLANPGSHFHVVVTNNSNREQRIWETWNSWGYFNLRFDVMDDKGSVAYQITKNRNKTWTRNVPSWVTLGPGEHFVRDVDFDRDTWIMPFLKSADPQRHSSLKLRAVFEIKSNDESVEHGIWTGAIESKADDFTVLLSKSIEVD